MKVGEIWYVMYAGDKTISEAYVDDITFKTVKLCTDTIIYGPQSCARYLKSEIDFIEKKKNDLKSSF